MFRLSHHLLLSTLFAVSVQAQPSARVVRGMVFDSIMRAPLAGAVVQIALLGDSGPRIFAGTADAAGRYQIAGVPAGRVVIGFQHDALNALGLDSPLRAFDLKADSLVTIDLAIPSGPTVRAKLCGDSTQLEGEGALAGYVVEAKSERVLRGAIVRARWLMIALERGKYRTVNRTVTSIVGDDGRYVSCGLASGDAVDIEVTMPGFHRITNRIAVPVGGAARQDFRLADSGAVHGTATLTGRVLLTDGSPLAAGYVTIPVLKLEQPVVKGDFTMAALPIGTWVVEVRALGYEPRSVFVDVLASGAGTATITLDERAQVLDAVTVLGKPGGEAKILSAIALRSTTTVGTVFLPGNPWLETAYDPADVVRNAAGFRYVSAEVLLSSGCGFKYPPPDLPTAPSTTVRARPRTLAVYLNGARVVEGLPALRTAVNMRDVLAVEAYQDIASAPIEWRTNDACSVLAIWTKR